MSKLCAVVGALAVASQTGMSLAQESLSDLRVLVFSKTAGFRHGSIPSGIEAVKDLGKQHGFRVEATEDSARFTPEGLAPYGAVVFLNTTGDVLNDEQQEAFEGYIGNGGGYVGIHAAADTEYDWPFYGELMGAYFRTHPAVQEAEVRVIDREHPSTEHLSESWTRTDEWYDYRSKPRRGVRVLAELNEETYQTRGDGMNGDHPIAWCHEYAGGRGWYTGGGHTNESFQEPDFRQHILGGILWAAGKAGSADESGPGLSVGQTAPDVTVYTQSGEAVSLSDMYREGPVVLTFYRGGWCPYCTRALSAWEQKTEALAAAGGRLVALTPEAPDKAASTVEKHDLGFTVLSDNSMEAAKGFNVFFAMDEGTIEKYRNYGLDLATWNASQSWTLPAPGTFVIDREGVIRYAWADWDYSKRADPDEVIAVVEELD